MNQDVNLRSLFQVSFKTLEIFESAIKYEVNFYFDDYTVAMFGTEKLLLVLAFQTQAVQKALLSYNRRERMLQFKKSQLINIFTH